MRKKFEQKKFNFEPVKASFNRFKKKNKWVLN